MTNFRRRPCFTRTLEDTVNPYERHFGPSSQDFSTEKRDLVDQKEWKSSKARVGKLGNVAEYSVGGSVKQAEISEPSKLAVCSFTQHFHRIFDPEIKILERLRTPFQERQAKLPKGRLWGNLHCSFGSQLLNRTHRIAKRSVGHAGITQGSVPYTTLV